MLKLVYLYKRQRNFKKEINVLLTLIYVTIISYYLLIWRYWYVIYILFI